MVNASNGSKYAAGSIILKFDAHLDIAPDNIYMLRKTNMTDRKYEANMNGHISEDFQRIRPAAIDFLLVLVSRKLFHIAQKYKRQKKCHLDMTSEYPEHLRFRWPICMAG